MLLYLEVASFPCSSPAFCRILYQKKNGVDDLIMHGFMCGLGKWIITHTHHLRAFNFAKDRVAFLIVTALDAAQDDRKES